MILHCLNLQYIHIAFLDLPKASIYAYWVSSYWELYLLSLLMLFAEIRETGKEVVPYMGLAPPRLSWLMFTHACSSVTMSWLVSMVWKYPCWFCKRRHSCFWAEGSKIIDIVTKVQEVSRPWQGCISPLNIWVSYSTVDSSNYNCQGESKICIWVFRFP